MHKRMIKDATDEQVREFLTDAISMIKETNYDLYETLENALYKELYGCHFNDWMLEKATKSLINEDGTTGPHWTIEQTNNVARQLGLTFDDFNEYDWNYVINIIYSDYYGSVPNDNTTYAKMARKFIEDKDSVKGKALHYYLNLTK